MGYKLDRKWSDQFMPEVKEKLASLFIKEANDEEDMKRATDICTITLEPVRCAVRVLRWENSHKYMDSFTIRMKRPNRRTELCKIVEGYGDYSFFAIADEHDQFLASWFIGDLKVFRVWFMKQLWTNKRKFIIIKNKDNSSSFLSIKINDLPKEFIYDSGGSYFKNNN